MKIKHETLTDRIHLLVFDTQLDLTSTFLRFQEHYESPKFRGKIFSLDKFKCWYIKNSPEGKKTKEFTYYTDWNGFNIPSYVLKPFYSGKFDPISEQERQFSEIFKDEPEPFYVIGIHKEIKKLNEFIKHEIAHGLFYTDKNYKSEVLAVLSQFDIEPLKVELRSKAGYHEQVLEDECHAYSIDSVKKLKTSIPKEQSNKLRQIYREYLKKKEIYIPLSQVIAKI
jgi:hypothetical protein